MGGKFAVEGGCAHCQKEKQSATAKTDTLDDHAITLAHAQMAKFAVGMENVRTIRELQFVNATKILQVQLVQRHVPPTRMAQFVVEMESVCLRTIEQFVSVMLDIQVKTVSVGCAPLQIRYLTRRHHAAHVNLVTLVAAARRCKWFLQMNDLMICLNSMCNFSEKWLIIEES